MSIRSHRRLVALSAAGVLLCGGLLSGCGVSDEQLRPGVAAQVGDTEVSVDQINDSIDLACSFFLDQDQPGFPRSLARQQFVSILVQRAAAVQALAEEGLDVGDDYEQAVGGLDAANPQVPEDQRAPFTLLGEATAFIGSAAATLGTASYTAAGEDVPADPVALTARGRDEIASWLDSHDVFINPVFRLAVDGGQVVSDAGGSSVAASDFAQTGLLDPLSATEEQVSAAAAQLPPGQLCGAPAAS